MSGSERGRQGFASSRARSPFSQAFPSVQSSQSSRNVYNDYYDGRRPSHSHSSDFSINTVNSDIRTMRNASNINKSGMLREVYNP